MATKTSLLGPWACPTDILRNWETDMLKEHTQSGYYTERHGGAYDRGRADSYYGREYSPHYFTGDSYNSARLELVDMSVEEIVAYTAGYRDNETNGDKKDWN